MQIRRALISVSDKRNIPELGQRLTRLGVEILSTGGTAKALRDAGVQVTDVSEHTGHPEILGGRVKTLHPRIHGGLLFKRGDQAQADEAARLDIPAIDLVVVNLYPFRATITAGANTEEACEQIDIGGPTMLRAAAKNHGDVVVVCDPDDYSQLLGALDGGEGVSDGLRRRLAAKAFQHTAAYDTEIAGWLREDQPTTTRFADEWTVGGRKQMDLRYGENPHQAAAFYASGPADSGLAAAEILQGKALSYNNLLDADACLRLVEDFADETAAVIIKHTNPCGLATSTAGPTDAYSRAVQTDPVSYFGGIVGFTVPVDGETASMLTKSFLEVILAPEFDEDARRILAKKKKLRVLKLPAGLLQQPRTELEVRRIRGGLLLQEADAGANNFDDSRVATRRGPTDDERDALRFAWKVGQHVKSNAIVYARAGQLVGVGAGQMSRIDSVRLAAERAHLEVRGCVMASDAFFPFPDGIQAAAAAGITAVVQPGGSIKDDTVIAAADELGLAMLLTGRRHFRH